LQSRAMTETRTWERAALVPASRGGRPRPELATLRRGVPDIPQLFTYMRDAELRFDTLRMRIEERTGTARGDNLVVTQVLLRHSGHGGGVGPRGAYPRVRPPADDRGLRGSARLPDFDRRRSGDRTHRAADRIDRRGGDQGRRGRGPRAGRSPPAERLRLLVPVRHHDAVLGGRPAAEYCQCRRARRVCRDARPRPVPGLAASRIVRPSDPPSRRSDVRVSAIASSTREGRSTVRAGVTSPAWTVGQGGSDGTDRGTADPAGRKGPPYAGLRAGAVPLDGRFQQ